MRRIKLEVKDFADGWSILYDSHEGDPRWRDAVKIMIDHYDGHATRVTYGPEEKTDPELQK